MANIVDYYAIEVNCSVHVNGGGKLRKMGAKPGVLRLYRDMDDPGVLVIEQLRRKVKDHTPWSNVAVARVYEHGKAVPMAPEPEPVVEVVEPLEEPEPPPTAEELAAVKAEAFGLPPAPAATRSVNAAGEPVVTLPSKPVQRGGKR